MGKKKVASLDGTSVNSQDQSQQLREKILQLKLDSLRRRIESLDQHINDDIDMKNQLEIELRNPVSSQREGELNNEIVRIDTNLRRHYQELNDLENSLQQTLQPHIAEELDDKKRLEELRTNADLIQKTQIGQEIEETVQHVQKHQEQREDIQQKLDEIKEKIDSKVTPLVPLRPWRNRNIFVLLVSFVVILSIASISIKSYADSQQQKYNEETCNKKLEKTGDRKKAAKSVLDACLKLTSSQPNNIDAWKNAGRASLLTWLPKSDEKAKKNLIDNTKGYFQQAVEKSGGKDPQALFYWKFMDDFEEFTSKSKDKSNPNFQCNMNASKRYKEALAIYNPPPDSGKKAYIVSQSDEFILLELSHFLIHRDGESGQKDAIALLDGVLRANPDPHYQNKLLKNIWLSKADAQTRLEKYDQAAESLKQALNYAPKNYKILQDLGAAYAQLTLEPSTENKDGSRERAITYYENALESSPKSYFAWRNLSFLHYLHGRYQEAVKAFDETLTFSGKDLDNDNKDLIKEYSEIAQACKNGGNCILNKKNELKTKLKNKGIFYKYFITHELIEREVVDPFFDVEHDLFYKCRK
ncbi:tetratricopeptide repeat protein [Nostoc sp. DedQUE07]|uniref:tetratricopeptide repeat protein n=1 Tax=Nostoc sp. DedQUE07 TaxID=3075392 RepID=UPI002AD48713|nr:tetratricopeptide repeat protein [Nostoc sp. DedQUE07]MDZ8130706.1 tetratricopeptide repeat protein [Nostoc sp. DedQUE07]